LPIYHFGWRGGFLFRAPIGSDARKPAVGRIEEAARFEIVHML
jgi:hypothetical protein